MSYDAGSRAQDELAIDLRGLGKAYLMFDKPQDRLKQMIFRKKRFYREFWAFQEVDLGIRRGETVGIIGRNGSGKSTLLQVIAGTLHPATGTRRISGRIAPLLELGAGFNPEFTGRENVRLAAAILGLTDREIAERFDDILAFAGIGEFIDQPVKTYSSGMYARLAFSVAAHVDADILIIDEILAVGDAAFVQKCMRYLRDFKERGTLLFVSHDMAAVAGLCDRAIWMDRGRIRQDGPPKEVGLAYQAALSSPNDEEAFTIKGRSQMAPELKMRRQDVRHETLANSDKRNEIRVFEFDPNAPSYGSGGAVVRSAKFVSAEGQVMSTLTGGEPASLVVECDIKGEVRQPNVGFVVKDRLGQPLFGDNTYLAYKDREVRPLPGECLRAVFSFDMPYLPTGDYALTAAIADGTERENSMQNWIDEALIFRVENSHFSRGLVGIPMWNIELKVLPAS